MATEEQERRFYEKPALQMLNVGGTYQMVGNTDKDYNHWIWHEHMHDLMRESIKRAREANH